MCQKKVPEGVYGGKRDNRKGNENMKKATSTEQIGNATEQIGNIRFFNVDCVTFMRDVPDGYFSLAICDPPYGIGERLVTGGKGHGFDSLILSNADKWDIVPEQIYFDELFRVSKNQIIWGGNFFNLPPTKQPICWDKVRPNQKNTSEWEMAWTSFEGRARLFKYCANGGFVSKEERIHPTQKPVPLYRWLLQKYAKPGMKILDTHGGSFSHAIACDMEGYELDICEIDKDYFDAGLSRFREYKTKSTEIAELGFARTALSKVNPTLF